MVASMGTSFLQQISLMNSGVLDKIEETPAKIPLTWIEAVPYSGNKFFWILYPKLGLGWKDSFREYG